MSFFIESINFLLYLFLEYLNIATTLLGSFEISDKLNFTSDLSLINRLLLPNFSPNG